MQKNGISDTWDGDNHPINFIYEIGLGRQENETNINNSYTINALPVINSRLYPGLCC